MPKTTCCEAWSGRSISLQQQAHHLATHRLDRLPDGGQRRPGLDRDRQIVEADDGDVVGDAPPRLLEDLHGRDRHRVRRHEHGVEVRMSVEQRVRGRDRGRERKSPAASRVGSRRAPGGAQRIAVALEPIQGGGEVQGAVDGGDRPSSARDQVAHGRLAPVRFSEST